MLTYCILCIQYGSQRIYYGGLHSTLHYTDFAPCISLVQFSSSIYYSLVFFKSQRCYIILLVILTSVNFPSGLKKKKILHGVIKQLRWIAGYFSLCLYIFMPSLHYSLTFLTFVYSVETKGKSVWPGQCSRGLRLLSYIWMLKRVLNFSRRYS